MKRAIILIMLFIMAYPVQEAMARQENRGAAFLVDAGIDDLNRGNKQRAIHQFSKALMLEPDNKRALFYLNQLGMREGLYQPYKTNLKVITDLAGDVEYYQMQMSRLQDQKKRMQSVLDRLSRENERLKRQHEAQDVEISILKQRMIRLEKQNAGEELTDMEKVDQSVGLYTAEDGYKRFIKDPLYSSPEYKGSQNKFKPKNAPPAQYNQPEAPQEVTAIPSPPSVSRSVVGNESGNKPQAYNPQTSHIPVRSSQSEYHKLSKEAEDLLAHQDKLIRVLGDYLELREGSLDQASQDVVTQQMDLTEKTGQIFYLSQELEKDRNAYYGLLDNLDDDGQLIGQKYGTLQSLKEKYHGAQSHAHAQNRIIEDQQMYLASLEKDLEEAQWKIYDLLREREHLLNHVVHEVNLLKFQDETME